MSEKKETHYDVLIVGGGMVGLTLANLLRDSGLQIGVVEKLEPKVISDEIDIRVSAINRASLAIFKSIGAWPAMVERAGAFRDMHVWDATGAGMIHFDSAEVGLDTLGYIIENRVIQQALQKAMQQADNIEWICPATIDSIKLSDDTQQLHLEDGRTLECRLLVGADGSRSQVRAAAGIEFERLSYAQQAIVCTVATELPHAETAWQCFTPDGPLAFLPLVNEQSSIVWSLEESKVDAMLALDEAAFCRALEQAFEYQLGAVTLVSERAAFPLGHGHVDQYVRSGLALVGDAAHNIHPLAGQGANLGFLDAACLADVIIQARAANRQWSALHSLRKYERARKGENRLMESAMTGFKLLFSNDNPMLATVRNAGLGLVDQVPLIKQQFMRHALGGH
ncbi:MAG: UbiH/UbiF/VisC/COQ6 family ubiquinone biosynthesis hydroxylase [Gammaproteobacteria bacterium]|nr:UbiH/UbiF/VisC/COQ6 family ubiquinone biosynthesis hydroxylase [Gammaproteobacteria bacterium]